jgi:signal transduction histidine kinase
MALELASLQHGLMFIIPLALLGACASGWFMAGKSLAPVKHAFERQQSFMADTSHELRTPLSIIRAQAEVHREGDASQMRAALDVVASTASQLSTVVDDLFFLARADAAALSPRRVCFSLDELIEETAWAFTPRAQAQGSRLVLQPRSTDIEVQADPSQIQRLVALLIDNALRHADPGDIEISMSLVGKLVELRVEDGGPGIPPELSPRVFERFVRGSDSARASDTGEQGLGLGLAIAKSIVHAHQGSIRLQHGARGGALAVVRIPQSG